MTATANTWKTGTKIEYKTTAGLVWTGEIVEQDGIWRRLRWSDGPLPMWLSVSQLDEKAGRLKPAPKPRTKKAPKVLREVLSLDVGERETNEAW